MSDTPSVPDPTLTGTELPLQEPSDLLEDLKRRLGDAASLEAFLRMTQAELGGGRMENVDPLASLAHEVRPAGQVPALPGYEVLGELGRGGMGVVYKARQRKLNRIVALKMILAGGHFDEGVLARFQVEAEAVAHLHHPNIVQVYEAGEHEGRPFFSLEFCPGGSLDRKLNGTPLPPAEAAALLETLARAMHAAHQANVVHRDLKPANVLLANPSPAVTVSPEQKTGSGPLLEAERGEKDIPTPPNRFGHGEVGRDGIVPKITDFGLARRLETDSRLTQSGAILGTPSYMAPEQARGQAETGPLADVYALGAILYECLTGRPPFRGATITDTLYDVLHTDPVPPCRLQPRTPRDLETICLKCLHKEAVKRYASAAELADDLRRFQAGEPIHARPAGPVERVHKWVKRRPVLAAVYAGGTLGVVVLLGLGFWVSAAIGAARGEVDASDARAEAEAARAEAAHSALKVEATRSAANQQLAENREFFKLLSGVEKRSALSRSGWTWDNLADLRKAARLTPAADQMASLRQEAAGALTGIDLRLTRNEQVEILGQPLFASCLAYHPGGRLVAVGQARATGFALCHVALVDPSGKTKSRLLSFPTSAFMKSVLAGSQEGVVSLRFSPDGRWLAAGAAYGALHCWDLTKEKPTRVFRQAHKGGLEGLAFSPDGKTLYTGGNDQQVKRWSFPELKQTSSATVAGGVRRLAVHPTEGWLMCATQTERCALSADSLQPLQPALPGQFYLLHFLPDGSLLIGEGLRIRVENRGDGGKYRLLTESGREAAHAGWINSLSASADGALILSASHARQMRLWEAASGRLLADLPVNATKPTAAFHPDSRSLAVAAGHRIQFYELGDRREQTFAAPGFHPLVGFDLHPDGRSMACLTDDIPGSNPELAVWPLQREGDSSPRAKFAMDVRDAFAFHPASQTLACLRHGALALLRLPGEQTLEPLKEKQDPLAVAFSPAGRLWTTVGPRVEAHDLPSGRLAASWSSAGVRILTGSSQPGCVAAGTRWAVAGADNGRVYVLRGDDASLAAWPQVADGPVRSLAVHPDERLVAVGTDAGGLSLLRLPSGDVAAQAAPHHDRVLAVSFSRGGLLASGSRDRTVRLWRCDGERLREVLTLPTPGPVRWLAFHPDAVRLFVLLDGERAVRVYHLDRLRQRLTELGMGGGLDGIEPCPLPPAVPVPNPSPVVEQPKGPNGLKAELFADLLARCPVRVRYDAQLQFDGGSGSPAPPIPAGGFSARWSGWLKAPRPGRYTLELDSSVPVRLWLGGVLRLDLGRPGLTRHAVGVDFDGKPQALRVEATTGHGWPLRLGLRWAQAGGFALQPVKAPFLFHDRAAAEKAVLPPP